MNFSFEIFHYDIVYNFGYIDIDSNIYLKIWNLSVVISFDEINSQRLDADYMDPKVNYDKWPRRLRPKRESMKVDLEAPESPHQQDGGDAERPFGGAVALCDQRHCNGSLREHQRLLNLRSQRHKCSPRCNVKVTRRQQSGELSLVFLSKKIK